MSTKEYTLTHVSDTLEQLSNIALYLNSGAYTDEISEKVINHLHDKIADLQAVVNFMILSPQVFSEQSKPQTDASNH